MTSSIVQYATDIFYSLIDCVYCFPNSPNLKVNNRSFKILRLLGEGGFSYVYLVSDTATETLYALKKISCPFGAESVSAALKEAEAYSLFSPHENIIPCIDYAVVDSKERVSGIGTANDGAAKTVYILLPYYRRGNLQDAINANLVNHTKFPERRLMVLFLGVCKALRTMHRYGAEKGRRKVGKERAKEVRRTAEREGAKRKGKARAESQGDEVQEPLIDGEARKPAVGGSGVDDIALDDGEVAAYAHRDIKPGNIMISDDGQTPILMDLGSLAPSPIPITSRSIALAVQDTAAEHSTLPYRAPELFDVKTDSVIDTKVDIWSLGCTLYACLVGKSPFEKRSDESGGSIAFVVLGGDWTWPGEEKANSSKGKGKAVDSNGSGNGGNGNTPEIDEGIKKVVEACLRVEPSERPDVQELIGMVEEVIERLPVHEDDL